MKIFKIVISAFILFSLTVSANAKIYLVAVGVSDYPGNNKDLRVPANDAATVRYVYSKNSNAESVLLTNSDATKSAVLSKLRSTFAKATDNDIIVFFFSGHGTKGAFCAYDAQIPYSEVRQAMA